MACENRGGGNGGPYDEGTTEQKDLSKTTFDRYGHLLPETRRQIGQRLDTQLFGFAKVSGNNGESLGQPVGLMMRGEQYTSARASERHNLAIAPFRSPLGQSLTLK